MSELSSKKKRRPYLLISLISNLGLLGIFKYLDFFSLSINQVFDLNIPMVNLILPMGISFYTFQTLSYSIDVYRGNLKFEKHFGKFALYVSFFPQLVAGPIERADRLLPQFDTRQKFNQYRFISGFSQAMVGFFKKVVVADTIAIYVEVIFNQYQFQSSLTLWVAIYLFAVQIYCDFSGYSDIAIGTARILGFDLMENFRQPYFAKSITEFWQRWHISLSFWLRDYLYIPLGGNRKGKIKTYMNLSVTMLLGGLWHGASWNFIIWGFLNGAYLSVERMFNYSGLIESKNRLTKIGAIFITFNLTCIAWVFFRADGFTQATGYLSGMFAFIDMSVLEIKDTSVFGSLILNSGLLLILELFILNNIDYSCIMKRYSMISLVILNIILFFAIITFGISEGSQFIYFQF